MSIACDIQMATCDLSFEVSSDLSSWIFIRAKVKLDFSLPMQTPCEKEPSKTKTQLRHKLLTSPSYPSYVEGTLPFYISLQRNHLKLSFSIFSHFFPIPFTFQGTLFNKPPDNGLQRASGGHNLCGSWLWQGLGGNGLTRPSVDGFVIRVTALWLRSKVLLSHWSIVTCWKGQPLKELVVHPPRGHKLSSRSFFSFFKWAMVVFS